ncbi:RagB/SusD family nutrient uptake outer membrane protein [Pedobacter riviphilus]|uniref:RagB/SusD family nutrient uptake outer membrane protein n=1 Tax=Pedobacter riviphilus TaxID=2766984 RepID=A0ABX6TIX2_9SPHI|nr:RagB/SusD family nutrient uptake outer membrane protein [Pedobacter riviphilus]QNR85262.1 RagB/SusD family nutrient uptake outer membrane protein [Pedobacter riviphilus]
MYKNKFLLIIGIITIVSIWSCKKELDRFPIASIAPQTFFKTEKDLELFSNGFYAYLPSAETVAEGDGQSDNQETVPGNKIVAGAYLLPSTDSKWSTNSTTSWGHLRNLNYFLENYSKADAPVASKNHYAGVARFFRAWFYYDMVARYGDVPWYSKTLGSEDTEAINKPRDPRALVMDSVLADLNFAIANIRKSTPTWTVNAYVAMAFKARICLFEGTWRKYRGLADANKFLTEAKNASKALMDENKYSLYSTGNPDVDYYNLFQMDAAPVSEVILAREYRTDLNIRHSVTADINGGYGWGYSKSLINSYLMKDGTRFTDQPGYATMTYMEEFANRDPRLLQTSVNPFYKRFNASNINGPKVSPNPKIGGANPTGYAQIKFYQDDPVKVIYGQSDNDAPIIRYAEVLLIYAEARAELGELTQADLDLTITKIRARAGMPPLSMGVSLDPILAAQYPNVLGAQRNVLLEIRRERRIEMASENLRYLDLMRWKVGNLMAEVFKGVYFPGLGVYDLNLDGAPDYAIVTAKPANPTPGVTYAIINTDVFLSNGNSGNIIPSPSVVKTFNENKNYLFPLPTTELLLNKKLVQNPGW